MSDIKKALATEIHAKGSGDLANDATTLLQRAQAASEADHALTWWQAVKKYKKAVFWACVFSLTLAMQSCDATSVSEN